jgi:hypothetical protein
MYYSLEGHKRLNCLLNWEMMLKLQVYDVKDSKLITRFYFAHYVCAIHNKNLSKA